MGTDQEITEVIKSIKNKIKKMLKERPIPQSPDSDDTIVPSEYWSGYCKKFQYLYDIDEKHFRNLRYHTYHLTNDIYFRYMPPERKEELVYKFESLWSGLPEKYQLSDPEKGYGFDHSGRWLNTDYLRFQRFIKALYSRNIFQEIGRGDAESSLRILEIGGGYGGMAHSVASCIGESNYKYFIIDLPEVLLFSASYLSMHDGKDRVYLYDPDNIDEVVGQDFDGYSFVLLPNYRIDLLKKYDFSLAINISSLQEMKESQIVEYLDFLADRCSGVMLSYNRDNNMDSNPEGCDLYGLFNERFSLVEVEISKWGVSRLSSKQRLLEGTKLIVKRLTNYRNSELIKGAEYKLRLCRSRKIQKSKELR